jgi:YegS/Rv2252/BmrU family lipid kinase
LAQQAAEDGAALVIAVGGDGTLSEVVNGLMAQPPGARPEVATLPAGTGCDFIRSVGTSRDWAVALPRIARGRPTPCDVLRLRLGVERAVRYAINVAGVGVNGEVVRRVNRSGKRWGPRLTFLGATLAAVASWRPVPVELTWEGPAGCGRWSGPLSAIFLGNARYCGAGMCVAPRAELDDGAFDLLALPHQPLLRSALDLRRLYDGSIDKVKGAVSARAVSARVGLLGPGAVPVDVDGEQPGDTPVEVEIVPKALLLRHGTET